MVTTTQGSTSRRGTTIVIDGDWLAFLAASLTHATHYVFIDTNTNEEIFVTTSDKRWEKKLKDLGYVYPSDIVEVRKEKRLIENWEDQAKAVMLAKANKLKRDCNATSILIAIGRKKQLQRPLRSFIFQV